MLELSLAALLETLTFVDIGLLLDLSHLQLLSAELLICKLKELVAITCIGMRGGSLGLLSLIDGIEELVFGNLALCLLISESFLGLEELFV